MKISLTAVDPADRRAVGDVHGLRLAGHAADLPHLPPPCPADLEGSLSVAPPATGIEEWAAYDADGHCVASLRLEFPLEENSGTVTASVLLVHPAFRGQGVGARVAELVRERATAHGRSRILLVGDAGPGDPAATPGHRFATGLGARHLASFQHLRLHVDAAPAPAPLPEPLSLRFWGSTVPDDLVVQAARLEATLSSDAPTGQLGWEPQPSAVSRIRDFERMRIARGRRAYQCGIIDTRTGQMAAWTALSMTRSNPDNALQAVTVVDPAYRGRGLGLLVKAHNLAVCRAAEPRLAQVDTWNASDNAHMLRINAGFGFAHAGTRSMWELSIRRPPDADGES
ncbi:GNAT family N-acetyltransferase [Streptomyces sp. CNQ085]|uniref:GNAT family N-acetyltransferase n=1 Tax=Streptomyces sp. CNQ085 TaxID=2886944 RepID=UPI001F514355|nr:GNAT family N-acetyltransferase [Streptomyces sp. CNQ085]MCI0384109.1 GNAT family N-acetyltransferase [Streptomyces sp. CNQ085]